MTVEKVKSYQRIAERVAEGLAGKTTSRSADYSAEYTTTPLGLAQENEVLKACVGQLKSELEKVKNSPLIACTVKTLHKDRIIVKLPNGNHFLVHKLGTCPAIVPGDTVLADQKNLVIIDKIPSLSEHDVENYIMIDKPLSGELSIGGLEEQRRALHEVIMLPLLQPERFKALGITPPKGVLLHGPPGTGKTLLARSAAAATNATFLHLTASELVQKFIGEGAKLVKDLFALAKERAPSVVFIDEIDAIASTRLDAGTGAEREVQRTFLQLLAELDGFQPLDNVKLIACTNRKDVLDPALLRPGRIDRIIEVPLPKHSDRKSILQLHSGTMKTQELSYDHLAHVTEGFTGADIRSICTEAGYNALREEQNVITNEHFLNAINMLKQTRDETKAPEGMFG